MRTLTILAVAALLALQLDALAQESPSSAPATKPEDLKIPKEYKRRIVKGQVMYCTKTTKIGSRFPETMCLDETGLRAMLEQREQQQQELRRAQSVCGSLAACGGT